MVIDVEEVTRLRYSLHGASLECCCYWFRTPWETFGAQRKRTLAYIQMYNRSSRHNMLESEILTKRCICVRGSYVRL